MVLAGGRGEHGLTAVARIGGSPGLGSEHGQPERGQRRGPVLLHDGGLVAHPGLADLALHLGDPEQRHPDAPLRTPGFHGRQVGGPVPAERRRGRVHRSMGASSACSVAAAIPAARDSARRRRHSSGNCIRSTRTARARRLAQTVSCGRPAASWTRAAQAACARKTAGHLEIHRCGEGSGVRRELGLAGVPLAFLSRAQGWRAGEDLLRDGSGLREDHRGHVGVDTRAHGAPSSTLDPCDENCHPPPGLLEPGLVEARPGGHPVEVGRHVGGPS